MRFLLSAVLLATAAASSLAAQTASLLVLSKHDHTLAIVDPATLKVTARIPVGNDPHEVIASSDGRTAYVSNYGFGAYNTLAVVDLQAARALPAIDLGALRGPHGLTFVGGKTYFTAEAAKAFGRYDPATGKIDLILGSGQNRTHMIWVAPDQQHIITTNVSSATLSLWSQEPLPMPGTPPPGSTAVPSTDWNQTVLPVGRGSEGFDVSPDAREIWVANAQDSTISVVDYAAKKVVGTIQTQAHGANRLKITPDGKLALASAGPDLLVYDVATRKLVKRLPLGHGSGGIQVQPDGARAFVSCGPDNYVAVIDLKTLTVTGHIDAGGEPDGLAWAVR